MAKLIGGKFLKQPTQRIHRRRSQQFAVRELHVKPKRLVKW